MSLSAFLKPISGSQLPSPKKQMEAILMPEEADMEDNSKGVASDTRFGEAEAEKQNTAADSVDTEDNKQALIVVLLKPSLSSNPHLL